MVVAARAQHEDALLYEKLAARIEELVRRGTYRPGDRVPSVRECAADFHVSPATVLQAYLLLEGRGIVEPRPRSGYYVRATPRALPPVVGVSAPAPAATRVAVGDLVHSVFSAVRSGQMVPFGAAVPSVEHYPVARLGRLMSSIARRTPSAHGYDFPPGAEPLRRQIARRAPRFGCSFGPDDVVTTCGALEAVNLALRAVARAGDVVALESPCYFGVLQSVQTLGMRALELPTDPRTGLDLDALAAALERETVKAVVVTGNYQNPLGCRMPDARKRALYELCARRDVPLIEDDIYGDLGFEARRPLAIKSFDRSEGVLLCSSFSKTLAPGYRVGWIAPGRWRLEVQRLKLMTNVGTPTLPQLAVAELLASGEYERHLRRMRRALERSVLCGLDAIAHYFPEGTRSSRPAGGFVLWVELPGSVDAVELHRRALAERITVCPGPMFSSRPRYGSFLRLSCGMPWNDRLEDAMRRLGRLARELAR
jgi:DNA-binding transcriptional MocR family regulator